MPLSLALFEGSRMERVSKSIWKEYLRVSKSNGYWENWRSTKSKTVLDTVQASGSGKMGIANYREGQRYSNNKHNKHT